MDPHQTMARGPNVAKRAFESGQLNNNMCY